MHNLSYAMINNLVNQFRGLLLIWLAVKTLPVDIYGQLVLITLLIGTVVDLSDLGVNVSTTRFVAQYYQQKKKTEYFSTIYYSFKRKLWAFLGIVIVLLLIPGQLSELFFKDRSLEVYIYLSILGIFSGMFYGLESSIIQGKKEFKKLLYISLCAFAVLGIFIGVVYYFKFLDLKSFFFLNILVTISSFGIGTYFLQDDLKISLRYKKYAYKIKGAFNNFGNWMLVWSVFVIIKSKLDIFMMAHLSSDQEIAYYDLASKFTKPVMLVFNSYGQVLVPELSGLKTIEDVKITLKSTKKFCFIMTIGLVTLFLIAPYLIHLIIGGRYDAAISPLRILILSLIPFVWTMPYNTAFFVLNKPYVFTVDTIIGFIITVVGNYLLLPKYGAIGATITVLCVNLASLIVSLYFYFKTVSMMK